MNKLAITLHVVLALTPWLVDQTATPRTQLVDSQRHARYLTMIPHGEVVDTILNRDLIFYTEREVPRAYQNPFNDIRSHLESAWYNVSASKPTEPFGNGNREFPWRETAGMDEAASAATIKFLSLPAGTKIRWRRTASQCVAWTYPTGTLFGELLVMERPGGGWVTFEVRTLTKSSRGWLPEVYRPFPTEQSYIDAVASLGLTADIRDGRKRVFRNQHPVPIISLEATERVLGPLPEEAVDDLLSYPFRPVTVSGEWGDGTFPVTTSNYHIIPRGYAGGAFHVGRKDCARCHQTTFQKVAEIEPGRDWYGRVRGSDGIFSFHPFDETCISHNGFWKPIRFRQEFAKLMEQEK